MKSKTFIRVLLGVLALVSVVSTVGVYATWGYAYSADIEDSSFYLDTGIVEFYYKPEEVLPNDEEANEAHSNHLVLIRNIISDTSYNINDGSKKVIHEYLGDFGVLYGNYNATSGGTLKKVLVGQSPEAANVQFMMKKVSDTEYNTYSFSEQDLANAQRNNFRLPDGYIEVYKTIMEYIEDEDGEMRWVATRSYKGRAQTGTCSVGEKNKTVFSIRYDTWIED
ncbi:MAG: hypothetical protein J6V68_05660 [Clostridia bacterium]|nr:hypothetical protein [Clostridia bacterium]